MRVKVINSQFLENKDDYTLRDMLLKINMRHTIYEQSKTLIIIGGEENATLTLNKAYTECAMFSDTIFGCNTSSK